MERYDCIPKRRADVAQCGRVGEIPLQAGRGQHGRQVLQLVVDHEVDFGLATMPLLHPRVTTEVLFTREDVVICPPGFPLARESGVSLAQVSPYPLLALSRGSTSRQLLEAAFQQIEDELRTQYVLGFYPRRVPLTKDPFHKLDVKVKTPELQVSARNGYYGDAEGSTPDARVNVTPDSPAPPVVKKKGRQEN